MLKVANFEDFLNIYNAYQLYMASQGDGKQEQKQEQKQDDTPAWAQSLLDRMDKLEKRQPGVSIEKIEPVGLEDVIKKML